MYHIQNRDYTMYTPTPSKQPHPRNQVNERVVGGRRIRIQ